MYVCMPRKVTEVIGAFYFFKDGMYLVIKSSSFHPRPIAHYVCMYAFVRLVTFPAPHALMMCLHISAPIVSIDLVSARQPCNLLSQLSSCVDVEHSVCAVCPNMYTHILYAQKAVAMHEVPYGSYIDCVLLQMCVWCSACRTHEQTVLT